MIISREAAMYLLSELARVLVDSPGAKCHSTLGDGSPDDAFIVGSESLWVEG